MNKIKKKVVVVLVIAEVKLLDEEIQEASKLD